MSTKKNKIAKATKVASATHKSSIKETSIIASKAVIEKAEETKIAEPIIAIEKSRPISFPNNDKGNRCKALAKLLCELSKRNKDMKISLPEIESYLKGKGIAVNEGFKIANNVKLREALDPMFTGLQGKSESYLKQWAKCPRLGAKTDTLSAKVGNIELRSNEVSIDISVDDAIEMLKK